jgi:hypothetical protein
MAIKLAPVEPAPETLDDDEALPSIGEEAPPPDPKQPKYGRRQPPANVEKLPPKLSCGTASGRGFFVAHPDRDMRPIVMLVKPDGSDVDDDDWLLVDADVEDDLADVGVMYELVLCRTANGGYFLWRLKVEEPGGRIDGYNESAREALEEHAGERWIKLKGDRRSRMYETVKAAPSRRSGGPNSTSTSWCAGPSRGAWSPARTTT